MYRHEYKYLASGSALSMLEQRVSSVLTLDPHAAEKGFYHIRSLYFDDLYNSCYRENEDGTQPREKFRIRIYDCDPSVIQLELKRKEGGKTLKRSCSLVELGLRLADLLELWVVTPRRSGGHS